MNAHEMWKITDAKCTKLERELAAAQGELAELKRTQSFKKLREELAALREDKRALTDALNLILGIPTMSDVQLSKLILNCKAVADRNKEAK